MINECIEAIQKIKENGGFENYINYIQFPIFKNLEENTKINFEFPMTVLIGKNGSNKSSVLTALYGAPKGQSTGEFWFSTSTDPIDETVRGDRNRFFYKYTSNKYATGKEVLKQRAPREGNPDYWETARPVESLGMTDTQRNAPVDKNVVYIDFRGQLSAFDKYFYFGVPQKGKKQDFLREKSPYLKRIFDKESPRVRGRNGRQIGEYAKNHRIELENDEIKAINSILGKNYESIILVEHQFYDRLGYSAFIKSFGNNELKYSEANAGSGETAVIQLVHKVMRADMFSLILLDEPEVSLHPSAQKKIQEFLLTEIKKKKHQVVISSHSPALVKELPKTAIKLFTTNKNGFFRVQENVDYRMAFFEVEEYALDKKIIICEDIDAKVLIERALKHLEIENHFVVTFVHGGADTLLNHTIPMYAINDEMKNSMFFILDGDKYCKRENPDDFSINQRNDLKFLKEKVKSVYSNNLPTAYPDGGKSGGRVDQEKEIYLQYINYHYSNVAYLPNRKIPEQIVLNSEYVDIRYSHILNGEEITTENAKDLLKKICQERAEDEVLTTFKALLTELCSEPSDDINDLKEMLRTIFERGTIVEKEIAYA